MTVAVTAGTRFYIGPVMDADAINELERTGDYGAALAIFEAIASVGWHRVGEVESLGELGDASEVTKFTAIDNRRTRSFKTSRDGGPMTIVVGVDEEDEGQLALMASYLDDYKYGFRVFYNDAKTEDYSATTDYFAGMVSSIRKQIGTVNDVTKRTFEIQVNTAIYTDETDPTGS